MIDLIIDMRKKDLGGGFEVGRVLPFAKRRMVGPFTFFDQMGPVEFAKGIEKSLDVRPHPHIGLATLTYLFNGQITHRDSLGITQEICPEEVNWMIAGSGITHSERFEYARANGANLFGLQTWIALPNHLEEMPPEFHHYEGANQLPIFEQSGIRGRLIAGSSMGKSSSVKTLSPMFYIHWQLNEGQSIALENEYQERAIYVVSGNIETCGQILNAGQMAVFKSGETIGIKAINNCVFMTLGGEPIGERFLYWNFVSSSKERLEQAKEDWKQGRIKLPNHDNQEFIPLPE